MRCQGVRFGLRGAAPRMTAGLLLLLYSAASIAAGERPAVDHPPQKKKTTAASAAKEGPARAARIRDRLDAGEFGAALDTAQGIGDSGERARQFRQIAAAQSGAGDFRAARATVRRIGVPEERSEARAEIARQRPAPTGGAGGNFADFTELIELITSTVSPDSWDEVGGPGSTREFRTGVYVDPNGLMRQLKKEEQSGALATLGSRARTADLNDDMARPSELRMVSLKRLEAAVAARLDSGEAVLETMQRLAGLTQIRYVFVYPEDREIVIAGPAGGWRYDDSGRPVGRETGRPVMELDDLVIVLRTFAPGGSAEFGCSINTRDQNLKDVKEFVDASNKTGPLKPGQLGKWLKELQKRLGLQDVVVHGVPADTRVAQVVVEADYRMKLIGLDKLDGGSIPSYFELLRKAGQVSGAPLEALRWWLTMKYSSVLHDPERLLFEIQGSSVLVQSENQFVSAQGKHVPTGVAEPVNRLFAQKFTENYDELASRDPVFADLRNIFDMALVAALCRQEHLHERAGWQLGVFAPEGAYRPAQVYAPKVIESVINHKVYHGKDIVVQVAGGVEADLLGIVRDKSLSKEDAALGEIGQRGRLPALPEGRWWWDAAR